ncbi:HEPN domain-containing protein [Spirosoma agri]|uniref:HEPN domain-containing protein n=1 Tax=Spirosoma agri TaxID=1987381 RepID=A0A6M0INI1_9BACT|nr:HEPN domain-containing protein [Spirosoma agri]NEU69105.1 HEPN domain-containing protein [Spirosoma agri]
MLLAEQCLKDAQSLFRNESYRSAAGRAYYAYFDAVRALLASKNIAVKSHSAIRMLFGEHFVQEGHFDKKDAKDFHRLFQLRQDSDYEIDEDVSEIDALDAVDTATEFLLQTEAYLRQNGFAS